MGGTAGVSAQLQNKWRSPSEAEGFGGRSLGWYRGSAGCHRPRFGPTEARYAARVGSLIAAGVDFEGIEIIAFQAGNFRLAVCGGSLRHTDLSSSASGQVKTYDDFVALQQTVSMKDKSCPNRDAVGLVSAGAAQAPRHASESGTLERCAWLWRRDRLNSVCAEYERVCLTS